MQLQATRGRGERAVAAKVTVTVTAACEFVGGGVHNQVRFRSILE